jgi:hypothetical protein
VPRRAKAKGIYQRGPYWLDWDKRADGSLRSPNLAIFWYDAERGKNRSRSTGTPDDAGGRLALDAYYLERTQGSAFCPTCGQRRHAKGRLTVADALADYLAANHARVEALKSIRPRLNHVLDYLDSLDRDAFCDEVNDTWVENMRLWLATRPIVSPKGKTRERAISTIENSVLQLAAVINAAHKRGDIPRPAQFKAHSPKEVNRTPAYRASLDDLIRMFRYAVENPRRQNLHRFLVGSVATWARPDAVIDMSSNPKRGQWLPDNRVFRLNPPNRRQTKKYRATIRLPYQVVPWMDGGLLVPRNPRTAWRSMGKALSLPTDGESGFKLIRRSVSHLARQSKTVPTDELEMQLGHNKLDSVSELYAPFDPDYLGSALAFTERLIDEIEANVPGAFHRKLTGDEADIVPIGAAKRAAK